MDSETRFMVANLVTKKREVQDAQELFKEAREAGRPELLITDGLQSYHKAFNKEFTTTTKRANTLWLRG